MGDTGRDALEGLLWAEEDRDDSFLLPEDLLDLLPSSGVGSGAGVVGGRPGGAGAGGSAMGRGETGPGGWGATSGSTASEGGAGGGPE